MKKEIIRKKIRNLRIIKGVWFVWFFFTIFFVFLFINMLLGIGYFIFYIISDGYLENKINYLLWYDRGLMKYID